MSDLTPEDAIQTAANESNDLVLQCTYPGGEPTEFVAVHFEGPGGFQWIQHWPERAQSTTVEYPTVRNTTERCDPDFGLINEADSHLAVSKE